MYRVQFEDFRCFGAMEPIDVRPITLLIGENSTGKTSFLAGLRAALESFSPMSRNAFNRDPYFLGGFEQIAHSKGGRGGRAKSFRISIRANVDWRDRKAAESGMHRFTYVKGEPQPEIGAYEFSSGDDRLELAFEGKDIAARLWRSPTSQPIELPTKRFPPADMIRGDLSFAWMVMRDALREVSEDPHLGARSKRSKQDAALGLSDKLTIDPILMGRSTLSQTVFASAPVRTHPLRNYTPSELRASSEGAHVPLELSRAKARDPERWASIRKGLVAFGANSGLFKDIDVRQLGKGDLDPFQVMVKVNGSAMNLADVGYGISQVLPIIYQVLDASRHQTYLLQQPEVHLHPRAQAELGSLFTLAVTEKRRPPVFVVETHSDYLVDRIRIEVARGRLSPSDVTIVFFEQGANGVTPINLFLNDRGEIQNAPDGFRGFFMEEHAKLLGL